MGFEPCLSALERPTRAVRSETIAVRSFTDSVKSVMGITSHRMEGSAPAQGLPTALLILAERHSSSINPCSTPSPESSP